MSIKYSFHNFVYSLMIFIGLIVVVVVEMHKFTPESLTLELICIAFTALFSAVGCLMTIIGLTQLDFDRKD